MVYVNPGDWCADLVAQVCKYMDQKDIFLSLGCVNKNLADAIQQNVLWVHLLPREDFAHLQVCTYIDEGIIKIPANFLLTQMEKKNGPFSLRRCPWTRSQSLRSDTNGEINESSEAGVQSSSPRSPRSPGASTAFTWRETDDDIVINSDRSLMVTFLKGRQMALQSFKHQNIRLEMVLHQRVLALKQQQYHVMGGSSFPLHLCNMHTAGEPFPYYSVSAGNNSEEENLQRMMSDTKKTLQRIDTSMGYLIRSLNRLEKKTIEDSFCYVFEMEGL